MSITHLYIYVQWPALAGKGRSALSPAQPLPARKAKILLAVLYLMGNNFNVR